MVQLNPVPVFGAKKTYQYHLTEIFHRNFRTNGKRSRMSNHLYMSQDRQHIILTYFEPLCFGPAGVCKKSAASRLADRLLSNWANRAAML